MTGAAGGIGSAFFRATAEYYTFRLADQDTASLVGERSQGHEVYPLDVADFDACQQARRDIDTVVHLAATTNPDADFFPCLLRNNIQGTYWLRSAPNPLHLSGYVSERDLNHLLVRCIETPDLRFALVHGISNNRFKRLDITAARDLFGYAPQDDAFAIFQADLPAWLQG